MKHFYHYTKGCHLPSIVRDGIIKLSRTLLEKNEKPAVWLTTSPEWDSACNIGKVINADELVSGGYYYANEINSIAVSDDYMKKEVGMCRILISESFPVISWAKFKHVGGISDELYAAMNNVSREKGCPVDKWKCSFSPIPKKYWKGIEMFVDDQWVRWDEKIPIREFVDLCLSCNGKRIIEQEKPNPQLENAQKQIDFMDEHKNEIIEFWEANKHKKGYIEIYITPDYRPYPDGFQYIEKRVKKSSFKIIWESETDNYALVHFLWEATFTQYKIALPYEKPEYSNMDKSNFN